MTLLHFVAWEGRKNVMDELGDTARDLCAPWPRGLVPCHFENVIFEVGSGSKLKNRHEEHP